MLIKPFPFQEAGVDAIFDYFRANRKGNPAVAMPTGSGKSVVIGRFIERVFQLWPAQRFLITAHVKELVEQNADKLTRIWPNAPIGVFSAGLDRRDTAHPIVFGGIQSVINSVEMFGHRDLLIVDEVHLISPDDDTRYRQLITYLTAVNPYLRVIGLSATCFRMGLGMITDGGIMTDICYDLTDYESFQRLIAEGYLAPLTPKRTRTNLDVSNVGVHKNDFAQKALQAAVDTQEITYNALRELCEHGQDRRKWIVFASGIEHAEHCAEMLNSFGVPTAAIHSKITKEERDNRLKAYRNDELRCITNNNVLTTGFDHPPIDLIGMLRPTMSPVLWVQMLGRGMRPSPETGKTDCKVLDFAGNTRRLGPIDDPRIPRKKGEGAGEIPIKICEACGTYNHLRVRFCTCCHNEFEFETKIVASAATDEIMSSEFPIIETFNVGWMLCHPHISRAGDKMIVVTYNCGIRSFKEYFNFEARSSMSRHSAHDWWRRLHTSEPPPTNDLALMYASQLRAPRAIRVWVNKKFPQVVAHEQ